MSTVVNASGRKGGSEVERKRTAGTGTEVLGAGARDVAGLAAAVADASTGTGAAEASTRTAEAASTRVGVLGALARLETSVCQLTLLVRGER